MSDQDQAKQQLVEELAELRRRIATLEGIDAERRRAEEELRESEGRYRALAESTRDIIYILDRQGTLLYANQAASQCINLRADEIVGKRQTDLFPREMAQVHAEKIGRVFATGEVLEEDELFHFGPQEVWLRIHLVPLRNTAGQIASVMGVCHNITDRKRAEEALQKANDELERRVEERTAELTKANEELAIFQKFAETSGQGFSMADLDGHLIYLNPALCRMLGMERAEDHIGQHLSICYSEESNRRGKQEIEPALKRQGYWEGELPMLSRQGKSVPTWHNTFIIRDESGNPLRMAVVVTDITERKRAEEALRASIERYELAVRGAGVGIWDWDIRTGKVYYSPRWKMLFGYDEDDIGDGIEDWSRLLHPDERDWILKFQDEFLAGTSATVTVEYRLRHKDGSYRWIAAHALVVRDEQGRACRLVGSHGDITDRKQAEEALERERQSLWRMLQASDHERQVISYEIHDGLAQYLAAATMQFQAHDTLRENSPQEARKAYQTALQLVRQAHSESRRLISEVRPPVIDEVGLETAVSHSVHEQRRRGGPKIECHSDVQFGRLPAILENAIYRIVQEALTNACKHSKSEKVTVSMIQEGEDVRLEVRDWGIGFDPESVEEGRFGLEGIRQRVRLLGGRLAIETTPGSGALVRVVVPILERQNGG